MKNNSNALTIFNFKNNQIRTETKNNLVWFCLTDVCKSLDIKDASRASNRLCEKGVIKSSTLTDGGKQEVLFINESNLYKLIFRSNKPQARAFEEWVTSEVLPAIRQYGSYNKLSFTDKLLGNFELRKENQAQKILIEDLSKNLLKTKPRWQKIIKYRTMGLNSAEIGRLLYRSPSTISHYITAMNKLGLLKKSISSQQLMLNFIEE